MHIDTTPFLSFWKAGRLKPDAKEHSFVRQIGPRLFQFNRQSVRSRHRMTSEFARLVEHFHPLIAPFQESARLQRESGGRLNDADALAFGAKIIPLAVSRLADPAFGDTIWRWIELASVQTGKVFTRLTNENALEIGFADDLTRQLPVALTAVEVGLGHRMFGQILNLTPPPANAN